MRLPCCAEAVATVKLENVGTSTLEIIIPSSEVAIQGGGGTREQPIVIPANEMQDVDLKIQPDVIRRIGGNRHMIRVQVSRHGAPFRCRLAITSMPFYGHVKALSIEAERYKVYTGAFCCTQMYTNILCPNTRKRQCMPLDCCIYLHRVVLRCRTALEVHVPPGAQGEVDFTVSNKGMADGLIGFVMPRRYVPRGDALLAATPAAGPPAFVVQHTPEAFVASYPDESSNQVDRVFEIKAGKERKFKVSMSHHLMSCRWGCRLCSFSLIICRFAVMLAFAAGVLHHIHTNCTVDKAALNTLQVRVMACAQPGRYPLKFCLVVPPLGSGGGHHQELQDVTVIVNVSHSAAPSAMPYISPPSESMLHVPMDVLAACAGMAPDTPGFADRFLPPVALLGSQSRQVLDLYRRQCNYTDADAGAALREVSVLASGSGPVDDAAAIKALSEAQPGSWAALPAALFTLLKRDFAGDRALFAACGQAYGVQSISAAIAECSTAIEALLTPAQSCIMQSASRALAKFISEPRGAWPSVQDALTNVREAFPASTATAQALELLLQFNEPLSLLRQDDQRPGLYKLAEVLVGQQPELQQQVAHLLSCLQGIQSPAALAGIVETAMAPKLQALQGTNGWSEMISELCEMANAGVMPAIPSDQRRRCSDIIALLQHLRRCDGLPVRTKAVFSHAF